MSASLISTILVPSWSHARPTYVDFSILEPLFQIVVDSFIRDFADKCEIRDANLFLFGTFKHRFPDLGLAPSTAGRLHITCVLFAAGTLGNRLRKITISVTVSAAVEPHS